MGQKGLSVLHRIDSSMIWQSYVYNKNYKWLSYNLWFAYIQFYKVIFYVDTDLMLRNNLAYHNTFLIKTYNNIHKVYKTHIRFSYHIDLYCIEFYNFLLLLNVFFYANLDFFQHKEKWKKKKLLIKNFL